MAITLWVTHHHLITSSCWFVILIVNPSNQLICPLETLSAPAPGSVWCYKRSEAGDHTETEPGLVCMISQSMTGSEPGRWPLCHCHRICPGPLSSLLLHILCSHRMMMVSAPPLAPGTGVSNNGVWRLSPVSHHHHLTLALHQTQPRPPWPWHQPPESWPVVTRPHWSLHYVYTGLVTPLKMLSCSPQLPARNSAPTIAFSGLTFKYQQPERNYRTTATVLSALNLESDEINKESFNCGDADLIWGCEGWQ